MNTVLKRAIILTFSIISLTLFSILGASASTEGSLTVSEAISAGYVARVGETNTTDSYPASTYYTTLRDAMNSYATSGQSATDTTQTVITLFADTTTPNCLWNASLQGKRILVQGLNASDKPTISAQNIAYLLEGKYFDITFRDVNISLSNASLSYISTGSTITLGEGTSLSYQDTKSMSEGLVFLTGTGSSFVVKDGASITVNAATAIANNNGLIQINGSSTNSSVRFENGFTLNVVSSARRLIRNNSASGTMSFSNGSMNVQAISTHFLRPDAGSASLTNVTMTFGAGIGYVDIVRNAATVSLHNCTVVDNGTGSNLIYTTGTGTTMVSDCTITSARSFSTDNGGKLCLFGNTTCPATGSNVYLDARTGANKGYKACVNASPLTITIPGTSTSATVYPMAKFYTTLPDAVSAVADGGTIYVIADGITISATLESGKNKAYTIQGVLLADNTLPTIVHTGGWFLDVKSSACVTLKNLGINTPGQICYISGALILDGVNLTVDGNLYHCFDMASSASLTVLGGNFTIENLLMKNSTKYHFINAAGTVSIQGGQFVYKNGYGNFLNIKSGITTISGGSFSFDSVQSGLDVNNDVIKNAATLYITGGVFVDSDLSYNLIYTPAAGNTEISGGRFLVSGGGTIFNAEEILVDGESVLLLAKNGTALFSAGCEAVVRHAFVYLGSNSLAQSGSGACDFITYQDVKFATDAMAGTALATFRAGNATTSLTIDGQSVSFLAHYYSYLEDAIASITESEATVTLVRNGANVYRVSGGIQIAAGKHIVLEGAQLTARVGGANNIPLFVIADGGELTLRNITFTNCPTRFAFVYGTLTMENGAHILAYAHTGANEAPIKETSPVVLLCGNGNVTVAQGASIRLDYESGDDHEIVDGTASIYIFRADAAWCGSVTVNGTLYHGWNVASHSAVFYLESAAGEIVIGADASIVHAGEQATHHNAVIITTLGCGTVVTVATPTDEHENFSCGSFAPLFGTVIATDTYTAALLGQGATVAAEDALTPAAQVQSTTALPRRISVLAIPQKRVVL